MARMANPNKNLIDQLREEGKEYLRVHKQNIKNIKTLEKDNRTNLSGLNKVNAKLAKLDAKPFDLPEGSEPATASVAASKPGRKPKAESNGAAKVASSSGKPEVKSVKGNAATAGQGKPGRKKNSNIPDFG